MIYIGTSGWYYDSWKGLFYPEDIPKEEFLRFYASRFTTVEINNTFYHLPLDTTLHHWRERVPDSFLFSVKASRYITHTKRLIDPQKSTKKFWHAARILEPKLGPVLFQLPLRFRPDPGRLQRFLEILPRDVRSVFEFRDRNWFQPDIFALLKKFNVAFCIYDYAGYQSPKEITADFVYVRLHGAEGAYQGKYTDTQLSAWAHDFQTWSNEHKDVYCYFDNDQKGFAAQNAMELQSILEQSAEAPCGESGN
ncbi:MAG: DUF72 domain-containing protein [Nitrospirota bacterium]